MSNTNYLPLFMTRRIPGQDSNDIFDVQARFRQSQSFVDVTNHNKPEENQTLEHKAHPKFSEFEDIKPTDDANIALTCRRSLSEGKIKQDPSTKRSPPVAVGKENVGTHFKSSLSPRVSMNTNAIKSVGNSDEESSGDEASTGMKSIHKPTSKKEADSVSLSQLGDSTNMAKVKDNTCSVTQKQAEILEHGKYRRPCIRVREPPGGKSSIVFH